VDFEFKKRNLLALSICIPQSFCRFFDSSPNFFASLARHGGISYDPLGIELRPDSLKVLAQLIVRELVGFRGNYNAGLLMSSKPLIELQIQCCGFVTRIYDLN
jgi:hypothetical protein